MVESWRDVRGWIGIYQVSNRGRIKSLPRPCRNRYGMCNQVREKFLKGWKMQGYTYVGLRPVNGSREDKAIIFAVHRLVLEAFVGPCPEKMQCRHLDGDRTNNYLGNLEWGTPQENMDDREKHGETHRGSRCVKAKLTEEDIPNIRGLLDDRTWWGGMSSIAKEFGVDTATIRDVKIGKTWGHVK